MAPREPISGPSKMLGWMVAIFLVFQVIAIIQAIANLAQPHLLSAFFAEHNGVTLGYSCMSMIAWAVPVLSILLLAQSRKIGYVSGVRICAITALSDWVIKFVLGIAWGVMIAQEMMAAGGPTAPSSASALAAQMIDNHLLFFYFMQAAILIVGLITIGIFVMQLRTMNGIHYKTPEPEDSDRPDEEETDLGEQTGWDMKGKDRKP